MAKIICERNFDNSWEITFNEMWDGIDRKKTFTKHSSLGEILNGIWEHEYEESSKD